ncbi:hypothetical protein L1987_15096 [Smallanthus sonchifolius]|uniref:Uncharacterized protein n=1 Tax=Smallanthus sonchifolius TaxID=185202 RepID=A0ACB9J559_9ASTR|nr:hypothetical protein L1987_15096 [Smallanthus sonchifolius]
MRPDISTFDHLNGKTYQHPFDKKHALCQHHRTCLYLDSFKFVPAEDKLKELEVSKTLFHLHYSTKKARLYSLKYRTKAWYNRISYTTVECPKKGQPCRERYLIETYLHFGSQLRGIPLMDHSLPSELSSHG